MGRGSDKLSHLAPMMVTGYDGSSTSSKASCLLTFDRFAICSCLLSLQIRTLLYAAYSRVGPKDVQLGRLECQPDQGFWKHAEADDDASDPCWVT